MTCSMNQFLKRTSLLPRLVPASRYHLHSAANGQRKEILMRCKFTFKLYSGINECTQFVQYTKHYTLNSRDTDTGVLADTEESDATRSGESEPTNSDATRSGESPVFRNPSPRPPQVSPIRSRPNSPASPL